MYCPKCKESFDEGSRRFCPTDGARLISGLAGRTGAQNTGIFANLIPKIDGIKDLTDPVPQMPLFVASGQGGNAAESQINSNLEEKDILFELDFPQPDPVAAPTPLQAEPSRPEPIQPARKINPFEIPAGHVNLEDSYRLPDSVAEFDSSNPTQFVGRLVKGRYKVTEFLGEDETGAAYLADDKIVDDRKVLVRILIEDGYDDIMASILAEERVSLSHFSHPNIARLFDSGQFTNGTNFLVTEHIDGLSVDDILSIHGRFSPARTARVIRQAASALNEGHQEGIIHRDVRPDNLIIDTLGGDVEQTKVVSFGTSNGAPNEYSAVYKAPEVLEGRVATVASDIFSLAIVAYEMLSSQLPFNGSTAKEIVRSQSEGRFTALTGIRTDIAKSVDNVFARAFAYNPVDRYSKARDFGDALYAALTEPVAAIAAPDIFGAEIPDAMPPVILPKESGDELPHKPVTATEPVSVKPTVPVLAPSDQPAWRKRSQDPPEIQKSRNMLPLAVGILAVLVGAAVAWYFLLYRPGYFTPATDQTAVLPNTDQTSVQVPTKTEIAPEPRRIEPPPNSVLYQNSKENLKGDLVRNFVGFSLYYPKDWRVNGSQPGTTANARGKFLDVSRETKDGQLVEQMLISYYSSLGTFSSDANKFPQLVRETNETLNKLLPGYQMVSQGEITINGAWRAYEIKFQGSGTADSGEKLIVWGRRLFIPVARPGVRSGFELTMLATSLAEGIGNVNDVGTKGELAAILATFEPAQSF